MSEVTALEANDLNTPVMFKRGSGPGAVSNSHKPRPMMNNANSLPSEDPYQMSALNNRRRTTLMLKPVGPATPN